MNSKHLAPLGLLGILGALLLSTSETERPAEPATRATARAVTTRLAQPLAGLSAPDLGPLRVTQTPAGAQAPYVEGQLMVAPARDADLQTIASAHGATVVRPAGPSGYGVLAAPAGQDDAAFINALRGDPDVRALDRHGLVLGAAKGGKNGGGDPPPDEVTSTLQWHLASAEVPAAPAGLSSILVAVLDTGVAAVPSLSGSAMVAPRDFVNGDDDPTDDHQHGTHIASVIASDSADAAGVAPGVSLMPLKVLNHENQGYELDLVDAIHWAVDHGADVINMSLSFGEHYVPSAPLADALRRAYEADIVLVGAAGNAGVLEVTWPAASPDVIAVGALCINNAIAGYSNLGGAMDVMAPGGCIDRDANGDGVPDGVIAETIGYQDPGQVGLWAMAGTSQAAAVASGAIALALAEGTTPEMMAIPIHLSTFDNLGETSFASGTGGGALDVTRLLGQGNSQNYYVGLEYHVAVLPYLVDNGDDTVTPTARITVMETEMMKDAFGVRVMASLHGSSSAMLSCELGRKDDGACVLSGPPVPATEGGQPAALAWRLTVDAVVETDEAALRPKVMMYGGPELDAIAAAQNADAELREAMLALYWGAGDEPELGPLAESYSVINSGSGLSTSPLGLLFTPPALDGLAGSDLSLSGTGLSTSPLGLRWMQLDGSGLSTSPLGLLALTAFDGSGLSTSPLGMRSYSMLGSGLSTSPILMDTGAIPTDGSLGGLQLLLDDGGWSSMEGEQAASALVGAGVFAVEAEQAGNGSSLGAVSVTP